MIKNTLMCLALLTATTCGNTANADFIFSFDASTPGSDSVAEGVGGNVTLGVFARLDTAGDSTNDTFDSYDLYFDLFGDGNAPFPTGVTFASPSVTPGAEFDNSAVNPSNATTTLIAEADLHVSADRDGFQFTTADTKLFDINLEIDSSVSAGAYSISFRDDSGFLAAVNNDGDNFVNSNPDALDFQSGSFVVVSAIPEPSALALLLMSMVGVVARRNR